MLLLVLTTNCAAGRHLARVGHSFTFKPDHYTVLKDYRVVQILDQNTCIAVRFWKKGPTTVVMTISDKEGPIYPEEIRNGLYVMLDTFTYENKNGEQVTVPLVTPIRDYEDMQWQEKLLAKREKLENQIKNLK